MPAARQNASSRESFTLADKRKVLAVWDSTGDIKATIKQCFPTLAEERYDARRKLIYSAQGREHHQHSCCDAATCPTQEAAPSRRSDSAQRVGRAQIGRVDQSPTRGGCPGLHPHALAEGPQGGGKLREHQVCRVPAVAETFPQAPSLFDAREDTAGPDQPRGGPSKGGGVWTQGAGQEERARVGCRPQCRPDRCGSFVSYLYAHALTFPLAVLFEFVPKHTLDTVGAKTIWVRCGAGSKTRATVMLLADSLGRKYKPTVVLKTTASKVPHVAAEIIKSRHGFGVRLFEKVKRIQQKTGMKVYGNKSGWWNEHIHELFLKQHFASRANPEEPILLLLDEFSGHWTKSVREYALSINVHTMKVPAGLTSVCQPADVAWMKPFKELIRSHWVDTLMDQLDRRVPDKPFKCVMPQVTRFVTGSSPPGTNLALARSARVLNGPTCKNAAQLWWRDSRETTLCSSKCAAMKSLMPKSIHCVSCFYT
jgi:hypothetical protein